MKKDLLSWVKSVDTQLGRGTDGRDDNSWKRNIDNILTFVNWDNYF